MPRSSKWRHHSGDVLVLCVLLVKSLPSGSFLFLPEWTYEADAAFLTIATRLPRPPPATKFEEDDPAHVAGVNIAVEACDS